MPSQKRVVPLHPHVTAVLREMGEDDPYVAIRIKAQGVVSQYHQTFGETPPFNMQAVASLQGLYSSEQAPQHSEDSEICPEADGRLVLKVNRDRPISRQRFSIGHEIGHTLFPEYHRKVQCRKAKDRVWADPDDLLESLCDAAASEILFPLPWFADRISQLPLSACNLAELAREYKASREATIRRFVELTTLSCSVVFLSWKLKPTQESQLKGDRKQSFMFGIDPIAEAETHRKLRVDYAIPSPAFKRERNKLIPPDKSIESDGPAYEAASQQRCVDGQCYLNLGPLHGTFMVHAIPVFTRDDEVGPDGECDVALVIQPLPTPTLG